MSVRLFFSLRAVEQGQTVQLKIKMPLNDLRHSMRYG